MSQMPDKKYSTSSDGVQVGDLLGITDQVDLLGIKDEVDNYSSFGSSCNIPKGVCVCVLWSSVENVKLRSLHDYGVQCHQCSRKLETETIMIFFFLSKKEK